MSTATEAGAIPKRLPGVLTSEASMSTDKVTVVFDDTKISMDDIRKALNKEGFLVRGEPEVAK